MSLSMLLVLLTGAVVGAAVLLLVWALIPREDAPGTARHRELVARVQQLGARVPLSVGAGLVMLLLTRWPVLAVAVALLVFFGPALFGGAASETRAIHRLEGLASWTESLRDTIAGAVGLEQAIPATAYAASPSIQRELTTLADRLRVRTPLPVALQRFADDMDDAGADLIVASLILNAQARGPGLRDVLTSLADSAREELEMRRRISASRASTRRSVQIIVAITVFFVLALVLFNRDYLAPYSSTVGQAMLAVVLLLFGAGFYWMRKLSQFEVPERFLFTVERREGGSR